MQGRILRVFLSWTVALQRAMDSAVRYDNPDSIWKYGGFRNFAPQVQVRSFRAVRQKVTLPPILDEYIMANIPGRRRHHSSPTEGNVRQRLCQPYRSCGPRLRE